MRILLKEESVAHAPGAGAWGRKWATHLPNKLRGFWRKGDGGRMRTVWRWRPELTRERGELEYRFDWQAIAHLEFNCGLRTATP